MRRISFLAMIGLVVSLTGCPMDDGVMEEDTGMMDGTAAAMRFTAALTGDDEVPPVDTITTGMATFELNEDGTGLDFTVTVDDGVGINQAHIHLGPPGENGNFVAFLFGPVDPGLDVSGELNSGTLAAADLLNDLAGMELSALIDAMTAGNAYVNVHSEANLAGEVRGQIAVATE